MGAVTLPGKGVPVEAEQQSDGSFRQSVKVAESALPTGAASEVTLAALKAAADAIKLMIDQCENWTDGMTYMLDSALWPVSVVEKIYAPASTAAR